MAATKINFNEKIHQYTTEEDRRILISVTEAIREGGGQRFLYSPDVVLDRKRGTYVHEATQFLDDGTLDWDSLDPFIRPWIEAYQNFLRDSGFVIEAIEKMVGISWIGTDRVFAAGTVDRVGRFPKSAIRAVLDLKSVKAGGVAPATALQLAAYANGESPGKAMERVAVALRPDGTYSAKIFPIGEFQEDLLTWYACARVAIWKRRNR